MATASLVAIATGLSAGTTLVTYTALAAVATALALVGRLFSSFLRAATAALLSFGATFMLAAALGLLAGSDLLAAGAGALLTSTALGIGCTVASFIATAAVLAGTEFLFRTLAVGLVTALRSFFTAFVLATTGGLASTECIDILLDAIEDHLANTLGGQRSTGDAIDLSLGFAGTLLDNGEGYLAISHHGTTDELALELLFLDEGTETGGLALMVEVSAEDLLEVGRNGDITPEATPEAAAFQGQYEGIVASGGLSLIDGELLANLLGLDLESTAFGDLTVGSDDACLLDQFVELGFHIALGNATNVEGSKDLFLLVNSHIGILGRLQRTAHEGQQEGYEHHHHSSIADGVNISVGVNAL